MRWPFITRKAAEAEKTTAISEAIGSFAGDVDSDQYKYRSLTQSKTDLPVFKQDRMINVCLYLYATNPLAHRIVEMTKDYIIGEGIGYEADDEKVKKVLDTFWYDPVNKWGERQHQFFAEIGLYGELALPVAVNERSGAVQLGYVNPATIKAIKTNPDNCLIAEKLVVKNKNLDQDDKVLNIINKPMQEDGECFFFKVNAVSDGTRGISDLYPIADWLGHYDKFLFNRLDRAELINNFVWDVTLEGLSEQEIEKYKLKNSGRPKPGTVRYHNNKVEWKAIAPLLNAEDASADAKLFKNHILSAAGFPDYFFASTDTGAIVSEMSEPTLKKISARQLYVKYMITTMFNFVIDKAIQAGKLEEGVDRNFAVLMPDISQKDNNRNARAIAHLGTFTKQISGMMGEINNSVEQGTMPKDTGATLLLGYDKVLSNTQKAINLLLARTGVNTGQGDSNAGKKVKL